MNRIELKEYIKKIYNVDPDYPWNKYQKYEVFRHKYNKKWFAIIMEIPENKLGLKSNNILEIVNFKCEPMLLGSLLKEKGFFPAYHMNKSNWITVVLDGSVKEEKIKILLDISFSETSKKK